jgi:hypothetical protein
MTPSKNEISTALTNYNFFVNILGQVIDKIEDKNQNDNRWFIISEKIARKYLNQSLTLLQILKDDIYIVKNGHQSRFIDFSSIYSLLRVKLETYSVFYHLFVDRCEMEEKILRFRLWELDGLRTIEKYDRPEHTDITSILTKNKEDIDNCISVINRLNYFRRLDTIKQNFLLKNANWRFSSGSLANKEKQKWKLSISQMIMNTGLKESLFTDWYTYSSTHAHTTYWSVIQNDTLTDDEKITMEYVGIMEGAFITSFMIKDFCKIYEVARSLFESLPVAEQEVIDSFNNQGRM